MAMLDLVALATVADVAPLIGVNRAFVRAGLNVMARRAARAGGAGGCGADRYRAQCLSPGLRAGPAHQCRRAHRPADLGARLLACPSAQRPRPWPSGWISSTPSGARSRLWCATPPWRRPRRAGSTRRSSGRRAKGWHPGVVGIVASRLKEATNRPAIVIGLEGDEGKGSGRSVSGVDLGHAMQRLAAEGLLIKGGGHKMAAGLTVARDRLEPAMARLSELLARQGAGRRARRPAPRRAADAGAATPELVEQIEAAGPFGAGAPGPRYAFPDMEIRFAKRVGATTSSCAFGDGTGPSSTPSPSAPSTGRLGPRWRAMAARGSTSPGGSTSTLGGAADRATAPRRTPPAPGDPRRAGARRFLRNSAEVCAKICPLARRSGFD